MNNDDSATVVAVDTRLSHQFGDDAEKLTPYTTVTLNMSGVSRVCGTWGDYRNNLKPGMRVSLPNMVRIL